MAINLYHFTSTVITLLSNTTTTTTTNPPTAESVPDYSHELPTVLNDLIPLSHILDRIISQAHHDLANLTETLPSAPDQARKRAIVDYVLQTRRQILKLLVLVRWSSEAENLAKCMNIIGFLGRQNDEFDNSITSLTSVKSQLSQARIRNSDLPTSLTVLRTGNYSALPAVVREGFEQPEKLSDETVLKTLEEVEEVLRWRLGAGREVLPAGMRGWWIADGRVHFRVPGMWEASFTYGGGMDDPSDLDLADADAEEGADSVGQGPAQGAEWYLLSLKFLFRVRDARGVWSPTPTGPMKEHIIDLCNRELARRRGPSPPPPATGEEASGAAPPAPKKRRDTPLVRGYNFLQRLALSYQLESLHQQALQLANTSWSSSLKIEMNRERTELRVGYWCPPKPDVPPTQPNRAPSQPLPPPPSAPATLIFSLSTSSSSSSSLSREKVLERILEGKQEGEEGEEEVVGEKLGVEWKAEGVEEVRRGLGELELDSDLSLEILLLTLTTSHATTLTHQLYQHLLSIFPSTSSSLELIYPSLSCTTTSPPSAEGEENNNPAQLPSIHLHLFATHSLTLSLSPLTGRLSLISPSELSLTRETRLRSAADKINAAAWAPGGGGGGGGGWAATMQSASETLVRVRASTILDEVESRAAVLGLQTTRRLPLRSIDLARFGADTRSCLFVRLSLSSPSGGGGGAGAGAAGAGEQHYLVLVMSEQGFRFALIGTREGSDGVQSWVGIGEVGWVELERGGRTEGEGGEAMGRPEGEGGGVHGFDVTIEDLRELHSYCLHRLASHHLERQLHSRRIPFLTISPSPTPALTPTTTTATTSTTKQTPYLLIHSKDLLAATAEGLGLGAGAGAAKGGAGALAKAAFDNVAVRCSVRGEVVRLERELGDCSAGGAS
ncbi:mediator complex subunit MED14-domain-containing protein [Leucosporidium creatinivorum]|uniref:Mediator of RNA polymerase II transcription subunit 14 n=1 Tax=Leucosporidium creatinivorum TaxID=106004 RepID=A0A1Y2G287_9BASI|nr:mediator complex subunit MED14-domain-containing protein [Leucosporidium creatinivorum]